MKTKYIILSVATAFVLCLLCNCPLGCQNAVKTEIREKLLIDTLYITKTDTMPVPKKEYIVKYIKVPVPKDSTSTSTGIVDSLQLEVVQRTYSDDSTYTAYVSGVAVDSFPRLDSISVTQRTILIDHEIERTIIKKRLLSFGVQGGAGYGITTKKPDIYIGIGFELNF